MLKSAITLPNELLSEILALLPLERNNPLDILVVSSVFYDLYSQLIYSRLTFTKASQVTRFLATFNDTTSGNSTLTIPQPIRTVTVDVFNDPKLGLYTILQALFRTCAKAPNAEIDDLGRVVFESLKFRFHTHAMDNSLHMIYEALACVNPRSFTWVGPDPPHHFSAAIVPAALKHVLRALATHTHLTHLTLTHVKFPDNGEIIPLPPLPSLRVLNFSQVIFLQPSIIAGFLTSAGSQLEAIHLVDAYQHSIWGPRLRRSHIEAAVCAEVLGVGTPVQESTENQLEAITTRLAARVRHTVVCQGKTERIIGGDRVLRDSILI